MLLEPFDIAENLCFNALTLLIKAISVLIKAPFNTYNKA